jgi:hypothetical protein
MQISVVLLTLLPPRNTITANRDADRKREGFDRKNENDNKINNAMKHTRASAKLVKLD